MFESLKVKEIDSNNTLLPERSDMVKFAVVRTENGDDVVHFVSESREECWEYGENLSKRKEPDVGLVSLISANFDDNGQRTDNRYQLYHTWIY